MNIEWDPKIGPATIVSVGGALAVLITLGVSWGKISTQLDHVLTASKKTDESVDVLRKENNKQNEKIAAQSSQISGMQSTISFIIPTLQRIESRLETAINTPRPSNGPH